MSRKVIVSTLALAALTVAGAAFSIAGCKGELNANFGNVPSAPTPPPPVPPPPPPPVATTPPAPPPVAVKAVRNVKIEGDKVQIPGEVEFDFGKPTIRETKQTTDVLTTLKEFLDQNPNVGKLQIEGHTDNVGTKASNQKLSEERAANVVKWLAAKGVKRERLVPVGFGDTRPKAANDTDAHKQQNRRTEFHIAELDGKAVAPATPPTPPPAASTAASAAATGSAKAIAPKK